ncbi:hypothetical protein FACS1894191_3760 [Clostridia bacterium]|nr:hypothetical protein FACS1894191_3760 [Clostridia bacterium]
MNSLLSDFHEPSFQLGMIEAFCEMVARGVKPLALSPVIEPRDWPPLREPSDEIAKRFGVCSYVERGLIPTYLAPEDETDGKIIVMYYKKRRALDAYLALKADIARLVQAGDYGDAEKRAATARFENILGYREEQA